MKTYVHGYSKKESNRLADQAGTLAELLHVDTIYPPGSKVLKAGCGIGAQTSILVQNCPPAQFVSIDISQDSIKKAKTSVKAENVIFGQADIFDLPFEAESFDHIFICFVLEHLQKPIDALVNLKKVLKKGGSITVIEGDHGSFYCYPESKEALMAVKCLIDVQASLKGNSLIGRQLYPLLNAAEFKEAVVSPRIVYVDSSKPGFVEGFSKNTFIAMVEGVKEHALSLNLIDEDTWNKGISDLYRATGEDGTFCYTFFKGRAVKI
ncbi:MAG: methyltransferase domain-containing protein [Desulfobacterales bacterium]|jgi:SAM-dependent methyltransferase